jgi:hypothetical protein
MAWVTVVSTINMLYTLGYFVYMVMTCSLLNTKQPRETSINVLLFDL